MNLFEFLPKKKVKGIVGFKIAQVRGKEEVLIAVFMVPQACRPIRVNGELVLDPIVGEIEVPVWP